MSCTIHLKSVSYKLDDKILFQNVDLHLYHKDKVAIIGPNGVGKTTLLKVICGLKRGFEGDIFLFDKKMINDADFDNARKRIGFLFQNSDDQFIFPTVKDDIAFGLFNLGYDRKIIEIKVNEIMEKLNIVHLENKSPFKLSGGEKKLVALAGILVCNPEILLLDEPTTGLDEEATGIIGDILKSLDKTVLIVSHDTEFVKRVTQKQFLLTEFGLQSINKG